jgi:hypothetical protein
MQTAQAEPRKRLQSVTAAVKGKVRTLYLGTCNGKICRGTDTVTQGQLFESQAALSDADGCLDTVARNRKDTSYDEQEIRLSLTVGA